MASGNTLVAFSPTDNVQPATNPATLDLRNLHPALYFDDTTAEAATFTAVMPRHYAGGGITLYFHWAATSATSGTIGWKVYIERMNTDLDADSFTSAATVTAATVNGTAGIITITSLAVTNGANMDSIAVGDSFRLWIERDVANDTATGDAELYAIEIKET